MTPIDRLAALRARLDTLHACNRSAARTASPIATRILAGLNRDAARMVLAVRTELGNGQRNAHRYGQWEAQTRELERHSEYYRTVGAGRTAA